MRAPAGLHLAYVSRAEYEAARWDDVLGIATFNGTPALAAGAAGIPIAQINTPVLPGDRHLYEVWSSGRPAESGQHSRVRFRRTEEMLFGCIAVPERDFNAPHGEDASPTLTLHEATAQAYAEICATLPAASALGATSDSPLVVYFLAGRVAPVFVENPRQVSAYHYPRQYGTHSPVFSRAALLRQSESLTLFISGTASIVGHRSLHVGDTSAQTRETLTNIAALLSEANRLARGAHFDLDALAYKVYVRRPADLSVIQAQLASALGARAQIVYLQADICRRDLLVEIEATGICPLAAAA
jgi:chorismate lyase/3-hydroxybenzoate synthase